MKRRHTAAYKAEVLLELLREDKAMSKIAAERKVAPTQLSQWKALGLKRLPMLFDDEQREVDKIRAEYLRREDDLYEQIGRLSTELAWLKKKLGMD
jgi:transposase-like protein